MSSALVPQGAGLSAGSGAGQNARMGVPPGLLDAGDPALDVALPHAPVPPLTEVAPTTAVPRHVARHLVSGTSALGAGIFVERGLGFLANILAARFGGRTTFGAYSLAISTANNISTYAAGQIGSTAARFSGKYQYGTAGYPILARVLGIVSVASAALAALALWFGAVPLAHLVRKPGLTGLLRWAALSAVGIILLECARGFFTGQRRLKALILLSVLVGTGMILLLPFAASLHSPTRMIISQGSITACAVLVCLLLARPLGLFAPTPPKGQDTAPVPQSSVSESTRPTVSLGAMLREVWTFGFVQLAGLVAANLSGWWLMTLVARADSTLVQMGFFSVASQMRNIVGLGPSLLTEGSYAIMADPDGERERTPERVMALCTFAASFASLALAAAGIIAIPLLLHVYGASFSEAATPCVLALAVAVTHMGNAPAAARLSIVSIRWTGIINTVWAVFVAVAATALLFHGGSAARALTIYLAAHLLSAALVLAVLARKDHVPASMLGVFLTSSISISLLAAAGALRATRPGMEWPLTGLMVGIAAAALAVLLLLGRRNHWVPAPAVLRRLALMPIQAVRRVLQAREGRINAV